MGKAELVQLPNGRWIEASWDQDRAQWSAPTTREYRARTGLFAAFARTSAGLQGMGCKTYASKKTAQAAIRRRNLQQEHELHVLEETRNEELIEHEKKLAQWCAENGLRY